MNKLIRDKIPDIAKAQGRTLNVKAADKFELPVFALQKVHEELAEVEEALSRQSTLEELADLYEILDKYVQVMDFTKEEIEQARKEKIDKAGGFEYNYILIRE